MTTTENTTTKTVRLSKTQRRAFACDQCSARAGQPCRGSRIPGANTFGGGWGGPPSLDREHASRITNARERIAAGE